MVLCYCGLTLLLVLQVRSLLSVSELVACGDGLLKLPKHFNVQFAVGKLKVSTFLVLTAARNKVVLKSVPPRAEGH